MARVNVTVVGLGRLGTSFGLALKALNRKPEMKHQFIVTGFDRQRAAIGAAAKAGALDREVPELDVAVQGADLIILACPYSDVRDVMQIAGPLLKPGAVMMDTSPLKVPSIAWAAKYFHRADSGEPDCYLVGVTPMLNPEYLGEAVDDAAHAHADLLTNGAMIISPAPDCPSEAVQLISDLSELLEVKAHFVDPVEHDGIAAGMEGLPLLMQLALFKSLSESPSWDDAQWLGNATFFLATHRLADANPEMLAALIHRNRENMIRRLDALIETFGALRETLRDADEEVLAEAFDAAMQKYAKWQASRLSNRWNTEPAMEEVRGSFSLMGGLFPSFSGSKKKKK